MIHLKTDTANLLHSNPELYAVFESDKSFEMARFIHAILQKYETGRKVLDVGSGLGREVAFLSERGYDAVGIDASEDMVAWSQKNYPSAAFYTGQQAVFDLNRTFDALVCVGSTFLYNFTNEDARLALMNFRKHLKDGGVLYLDMRNAAFFLTKEGQRWLTDELLEEAIFDGEPAIVKTRFYIDLARQVLKRDYNWKIGARDAIIEHLEHRLFFPQEIAGLLSVNSFKVIELFDKPEPHINSFSDGQPFEFGYKLSGRRLQVIAKAI